VTSRVKAYILAAAVAVPLLVTTAGILVFSAMELTGGVPLSYGPVRNVAEAAALGHASEVLRLLDAGEDPRRVWPVRRDIISSTITQVTALEAAVWSRRVQLVELMDRQGAIDDESRRHMACLASELPSPVEEIVDYLSPDGPPVCAPGQALNQVVERSKNES